MIETALVIVGVAFLTWISAMLFAFIAHFSQISVSLRSYLKAKEEEAKLDTAIESERYHMRKVKDWEKQAREDNQEG